MRPEVLPGRFLFGLLLVVALFAVLKASGASADPDPARARQDCERAAAAYDAGDFAVASAAWQEAIDGGLDTAVVHYNLGNAYFKQGRLGLAIASYLRASRMDPRNPSIRTNLRRAKAQVKDAELSSAELPPVLRPIQWVYRSLSANDWLGLGLLLWVALGLVAILGQWVPGRIPRASAFIRVLAVLSVVVLLVGGLRYYQDFGVERGVVTGEEVDVRSGPGTGYNLSFRVHEGLPVRVAEDRGDWVRIDLGGELVGWIPVSVLEIL